MVKRHQPEPQSPQAQDPHPVPANTSDGGNPSNASPPSRRRYQRRKTLPELPLDIFYELLGHSTPIELLCLARTNKQFRQILMRKAAARYWKAARENVPGLPDCPPDLSEPAYANLVFDPHCHNCSKSTAANEPLWALRKRFCKKCAEECCSSRRWHVVRFAYGAMLPLPQAIINTKRDTHAVLNADHEAWLREMKDMSEAHREAFIKQKRDEKKEKEEHAELCSAWYAAQKKEREVASCDVRQTRFKAIIEKLNQNGWEAEVNFMAESQLSRIGRHPLNGITIVKVPRPLTDRTWPRVYQELLPTLQGQREALVRYQRKCIITDRIKLFNEVFGKKAPVEQLHLLCEIANLTEVKNLIVAPSNETITLEDFTRLLDVLPNLVNRCIEGRRKKLAEYVTEKAEAPADIDPLKLPAGTYFVSTSNVDNQQVDTIGYVILRPMLQFPFYCSTSDSKNLMHYCSCSACADIDPDTRFDTLVAHILKQNSWSAGRLLSGGNWLLRFIRMLVKHCGKDPRRTGTEELDSVDVRFRCGICYTVGEVANVMNWRATVSPPDISTWFRMLTSWMKLLSNTISNQVTHMTECRKKFRDRDMSWYRMETGLELDAPKVPILNRKPLLTVWKPSTHEIKTTVLAMEKQIEQENLDRAKTMDVWFCDFCSVSTPLKLTDRATLDAHYLDM
ncbi:hypothetical protein K474DRAFT_1707328 [Panus rudis PR-1116 ss-1]|nr:hypothetical protein K474DRAFT_1707328 [Panus rudis PR-1116 ss-1]